MFILQCLGLSHKSSSQTMELSLYLRIYLMQVLENYQTMNMEKNPEANESLDPGLKV